MTVAAVPERTDGGAAISSDAATPGVMAMAPDVTDVRPGEENVSVRLPAVPETERPVNVARPAASVDAVAVPPSVPPPVAMAAVTTTPARATALPAASRSWTAGWTANAAPLWAVVDGCVVTVSCVATTATATETSVASDPAELARR